MRVDYNVPIANGEVSDSTRIVATIPTLKFLIEHQVKSIILLSHCGRPNGKVDPKYTLAPVAPVLSELIKMPVKFINNCVGDTVLQQLNDGFIFLLENVRFHAEEEAKSGYEEFRKQLTLLGDIYVNDAFGSSHRPHSSVVGIDLPLKVAGLLVKRELKYFGTVLESPNRPFLSILGGAKVKDKVKLIMNLLDKVNEIIIGGGMAYTFLKVKENMSIGSSIFDPEGVQIVPKILEKATEKGVKIHLPVDFVINNGFKNEGPIKIVGKEEGIPDGWEGLDCGPESSKQFHNVIINAKTIVWNGPLGVFEMSNFAKGSLSCLDSCVEAKNNGAVTIVGGGDTAALVESVNKGSLFSHVSTGGGASLELLEGKVLPGIASLSDSC